MKQTQISPTRERKRAFVIGKKSIGTPENKVKVKVKVSSGFVIGPYFFNLFFNIFNFPLFFLAKRDKERESRFVAFYNFG